MLALVWGWYAPALGVAKALGIFDQIYELEIAVFPKNTIGWLLPVGCWYLIFNIVILLKRTIKGSNKAIEAIGGPRPPQPHG
jgi:hypothetical protein